MGKLQDPYVNVGFIDPTTLSVDVPIVHDNNNVVWVIEQITVLYNVVTDAPQISVILDGVLFSGPAQAIPGNNGIGATFAGQPYLYMENDDDVHINVINGSAGATVTVLAQRRVIDYDHDELQGRF